MHALACLEVGGSGGILPRKILDSQTPGDAIYYTLRAKYRLIKMNIT